MSAAGGPTLQERLCPSCGARLAGDAAVDDLCARCLLSLGLAAPEPEAGEAPSGGAAEPGRPQEVEPLGQGAVTPSWMPADLLRQAARRLDLAALGVGLFCLASLVVNNTVSAAGWHSFPRLALLNGVLAVLAAVSAVVVRWVRRGRLVPRQLLRVGIAYEIVVAFGISVGDHLQPLPEELPLAAVSWLCVWIVIFPLVVPARTRWALLAGLAAASTWPLAYAIGLQLGNPAPPTRIVMLNVLENYIAVGLAVFSTRVVRRLQDLGCYQLLRKLDHGGMGEIWLARHRMLARPVAIKMMRPELIDGPARGERGGASSARSQAEVQTAIGRFEREAQATAALRSPHTVELHDFGVTPEGHFYYVMELLDGLDLESLVAEHGSLPPERVAHLLVQACDSLGEAHAAGLVHRDVKPGNIFACHVGRRWDFVKVLDFGLVKTSFGLPATLSATPSGSDVLTAEGTITGTPAYIAPEMALGRPLDERADIYGLGCVAYWLLTGERPFSGRTPMEVVLHHVRTPPVPPSQRLGRVLPQELESLVLACMAKEPGDRPSSAEWLASRLAECPVETPWTRERAREWWEKRVGSGGAPAPPDSAASTAALSGAAWRAHRS